MLAQDVIYETRCNVDEDPTKVSMGLKKTMMSSMILRASLFAFRYRYILIILAIFIWIRWGAK